jgi:hypothetical protein
MSVSVCKFHLRNSWMEFTSCRSIFKTWCKAEWLSGPYTPNFRNITALNTTCWCRPLRVVKYSKVKFKERRTALKLLREICTIPVSWDSKMWWVPRDSAKNGCANDDQQQIARPIELLECLTVLNFKSVCIILKIHFMPHRKHSESP